MKLALAAAIIVAALMTLFAVQNSQHTQVTFLGWYFDGPLVIVLLISYGAGALSAFLSMIPGNIKKSLEISKLKSALADSSAKTESMAIGVNKEQSTNVLGGTNES